MIALTMSAMVMGAAAIAHDAAAQPAPAADAPRPAAGPSDDDKARAREAVRKGDALTEKGEHAKALEQYQLADGIMAVPFTRMKVAAGFAKLGQWSKARENARSIADMPIRPDEPPAFLKARGDAQQLVKEAGRKTAVITFTIEPAAAAIGEATLDGKTLTPAALRRPMELDPGRHVLSVKAPGHQPLEHVMEAKEGQRTTIPLQLQALGKAPGPGSVKPHPGGGGPSGGADEGVGSAISPVAWVGFGVAGAGLIAGAVTGGLALGRRGELDDVCPDGQCPPEQHDALDSGMLLGHISTAGFALAGAGVALGLVGLLVLSPGDEEGAEQASVRLSPYVSPTSIGLMGSF